MKSAGKARNNGLYRHIRTSKEIIRNLLNDSAKKQKLEIASANGRIIESPIHKRFENLDDLRNLILTNLQISNFKNFHYFYLFLLVVIFTPNSSRTWWSKILELCWHICSIKFLRLFF